MRLNKAALQHAKKLIEDGKVDMDSDWSKEQPSSDDENKYRDQHGWDEYGKWFLAIDPDENEETKGRHKFPYGDFKKVHRDGVIAAKQRAAQYDYGEIEKAADQLLEMIDSRKN
jgi:creatinine amidohydrolase/Fe(II)-dependent formamide hydrolase-like protein